MQEIRKALKEYREAAQFDDLMLSRPIPTARDYEALYNTLWNRNRPHQFPLLGGAGTSLYNDSHDLMSTSGRTQREDWLSRLLQAHFGLLFRVKSDHTRPQVGENPVYYTSCAKVDTFVNMIAVTLAIAFLYGSIWSLYYVRKPETTLGLATMWAVLFPTLVASITNAGRAEIFGACAAYAAVLVVFVSNILGNGSR